MYTMSFWPFVQNQSLNMQKDLHYLNKCYKYINFHIRMGWKKLLQVLTNSF
jgi:hypothetical protein